MTEHSKHGSGAVTQPNGVSRMAGSPRKKPALIPFPGFPVMPSWPIMPGWPKMPTISVTMPSARPSSKRRKSPAGGGRGASAGGSGAGHAGH